MEENLCKNCNAELQGAYCHTCGQKASVKRFTMRTVLHNLFHGIFHCDRSILYTCYALFTRPGKMIADYIAGRRIRYFNPFTMLVIMASIASVLSEILLAEHVKATILPAVSDSDSMLLRLGHYLLAVMEGTVFQSIIFLPLFALAAKWTFGRKNVRRYNYTELLIAGVYIICKYLIISILLEIPAQLVFGNCTKIFLLLYFSCMVWDCRQLFGLSIPSAIWRVLLMGLCVLATIFAIIFVYALLYTFYIMLFKIETGA